MPQSEELSPAMQAMKRELLAAIAAVDARVGQVDARVGRVEATTLEIAEQVNLLCVKLLAPDEQRALKKVGSGR